MAKLKNDLIGTAGVHYVNFKLALRGLVVLPTIRNTAGIDLLVYDPTTSEQATLQVKTSQKRVNFWPTSGPDKIAASPKSFYVFLRYLKDSQTFEPFLETSARVAQRVKENADDYLARGRREFSFWDLPEAEDDQRKLKESWEDWTP
jgi:hypothetical protein